jgi:hypothetical protein
VTNVLPSAETVFVISAFAFIYVLILLRRTLQGTFDLYDFLMLSMVAIIPAAFALFPSLAYLLSHLTGVVFPFVVMFGALFLVVFAFMHNITQRLHRLERQNCALIQEQSLLSLELRARERGPSAGFHQDGGEGVDHDANRVSGRGASDANSSVHSESMAIGTV